MDQTNLAILQFLKEDLEKTESWTFPYVIEEALTLNSDVVDNSLAFLEREKMITRCLCGCNGIMIAPAGYDVLPKPENALTGQVGLFGLPGPKEEYLEKEEDFRNTLYFEKNTDGIYTVSDNFVYGGSFGWYPSYGGTWSIPGEEKIIKVSSEGISQKEVDYIVTTINLYFGTAIHHEKVILCEFFEKTLVVCPECGCLDLDVWIKADGKDS